MNKVPPSDNNNKSNKRPPRRGYSTSGEITLAMTRVIQAINGFEKNKTSPLHSALRSIETLERWKNQNKNPIANWAIGEIIKSTAALDELVENVIRQVQEVRKREEQYLANSVSSIRIQWSIPTAEPYNRKVEIKGKTQYNLCQLIAKIDKAESMVFTGNRCGWSEMEGISGMQKRVINKLIELLKTCYELIAIMQRYNLSGIDQKNIGSDDVKKAIADFVKDTGAEIKVNSENSDSNNEN